MIEALISGKLYGAPIERTSKAGRRFATAKVRVTIGDGESTWISVVAFSNHVVTPLLALADGDAVALAGALTASAFTDKEGAARPGLDLVAHQVLTAYHVGRKRRAMLPGDGAQARDESPPPVDEPSAAPSAAQHEEFNDPLPF
ncbi:MAG: single-stranded DNA-binding protein [Steroidobacteraceae bacterium]